jgi:hypothetical protein
MEGSSELPPAIDESPAALTGAQFQERTVNYVLEGASYESAAPHVRSMVDSMLEGSEYVVEMLDSPDPAVREEGMQEAYFLLAPRPNEGTPENPGRNPYALRRPREPQEPGASPIA